MRHKLNGLYVINKVKKTATEKDDSISFSESQVYPETEKAIGPMMPISP